MTLQLAPYEEPDVAGDLSPNGWTLDTLEKFISSKIEGIAETIRLNDRRYEQRFIDSKEAVGAALVAADRATTKAEDSQGRVNATQNEFRGQLKDQAGTFITRTELYAALVAVTALVTALTQWLRLHP